MRFNRKELSAIDSAIEYVTNAFGTKITAEDLSDKYLVPAKTLQAGFKDRTGHTIHSYIAAIRLHKAKELLADDEPLKCIAEHIGCKTPSQFGQFFKKHTGQTPLEYRTQLADASEMPSIVF